MMLVPSCRNGRSLLIKIAVFAFSHGSARQAQARNPHHMTRILGCIGRLGWGNIFYAIRRPSTP
jgi:hypothetical protein